MSLRTLVFIAAVPTIGFCVFGVSQSRRAQHLVEPLGADVATMLGQEDPTLGNPEAEYTIVEFSDFKCHACRRLRNRLIPWVQERGDVLFVHKDLPLNRDPRALAAAEAARCAGEQGKYWEYANLAFLADDLADAFLLEHATRAKLDLSRFSKCRESRRYQKEVERNISEARRLRLRGTPVLVVNGAILPGETDIAVIEDVMMRGVHRGSQ